MWKENKEFWFTKNLRLHQEMVFASTGTKDPKEDPGKYVQALAGADIQTNPPATNETVEKSGRNIVRSIDVMPAEAIVEEIDRLVDPDQMERVLLHEGVIKFADPHKELIALIAGKRAGLHPFRAVKSAGMK
jgi:transaldolase